MLVQVVRPLPLHLPVVCRLHLLRQVVCHLHLQASTCVDEEEVGRDLLGLEESQQGPSRSPGLQLQEASPTEQPG